MNKIIKFSPFLIIVLAVVLVFSFHPKIARTISLTPSTGLEPIPMATRIVWTEPYSGPPQPWAKGEIWLYDSLTGNKTLIIKTEKYQNKTSIWGNNIVWSDTLWHGAHYPWGVYVYNLFTNKITTIHGDFDRTMPHIDHNRIVWEDNRNHNWNVYAYNLSDKQEILISTKILRDEPKISGERIVWTDRKNHDDSSARADIHMYDLSTGQETPIAVGDWYKSGPDIYGNWVVWEDSRDGISRIYLHNILTGEDINLTPNSYGFYPAIYGNKVVWLDNRNNKLGIYMYNIANGQEYVISKIPSVTYGPKPDIYGYKIVWTDNRSGDYGIYMYDISNGKETKITDGISNGNASPSVFSPILLPYF